MIETAVVYETPDKELVEAYEALAAEEQKPGYWSEDELAALKKRVKDYYIAIQGNRCCYCNVQTLSANNRYWDIEHVASRAKHPRFMFTPLNLAVSCVDCNIEKGEYETMVNPGRKNYPPDGNGFKILHPHYDEFDRHIFKQGHIYAGKTEKGSRTIRQCNLLRYAQNFIDWENSANDERFEQEVDVVFDEGPTSQAEVEALVDQLKNK